MNGNACKVTVFREQMTKTVFSGQMTKAEKEFDAWKTAYKNKYAECQMLTEQVEQLKNALVLALTHYTGSTIDYDYFLIECGYKLVSE